MPWRRRGHDFWLHGAQPGTTNGPHRNPSPERPQTARQRVHISGRVLEEEDGPDASPRQCVGRRLTCFERRVLDVVLPVRGFSLTVAGHAVMPSPHARISAFSVRLSRSERRQWVPSGDVCFPRFGALGAAFGRDSCLQPRFEGEWRLTAAADEVSYGDSRLAAGPSVGAAEEFASRAAESLGLRALSGGPLAAGHSSTRR
jgi:hypothetical protein